MAAKFTLYYWPIPFRGMFVKSFFAYTSTELEEAPVAEVAKIKSGPLAEAKIPAMGPPVLHDHEAGVYLSQMPAILHYLSLKLGLAPEDPYKQALAMKVIEDANDFLMEMTRYNGNMMWEKETWLEFVGPDGRFVRWLRIFELLGTGSNGGLGEGGSGFLVGTSKATSADVGAFALFNTMERCLPELSPMLREHAPKVMALCDRLLASSEGLQALVAKQGDSKTWCSGYIEKSLRAMLDGSYTKVILGE